MKGKEIAAKYGIEIGDFEKYLIENDVKNSLSYSWTLAGTLVVPDNVIDEYIDNFRKYRAEKEAEAAAEKVRVEEEKLREAAEAARKKKAMAEMLITSGFNFDGYKIIKYSGYISGDDAVSVDRGMAIFGSGINVKDKLMDSLVAIRRNALRELKEAAYDLGCNAVIGVDFDYLTLDPQTANLGGGTTYQPYIFGVTANGNAVIIEKID